MHISLLIAQLVCAAAKPPSARYVFLFVGDGMGLSQVALTEAYQASQAQDPKGFQDLSFTGFPVLGMATTHCATRRITESSAAATAMATGSKADDGTLGVSPGAHKPLRTIAEEARDAGRRVGMLTTVSLDHATPAGFYAHVPDRNAYHGISLGMARSGFDLFAGGGLLDPVSKTENVWDTLRAKGYSTTHGKTALAKADTLPLVALPPRGAPPNGLMWMLDRSAADADMPTLADFVKESARLLEKGPSGFFVMAEAGRIDWAGHSNDARSAIGETQGLDSAVKAALEFAKRHPGEVLIVVTGDHETGGLALGNGAQGYQSDIGLLKHQISSQDALTDSLRPHLLLPDSRTSLQASLSLVTRRTGLGTAIPLSPSDTAAFLQAWKDVRSAPPVKRDPKPIASWAIAMLARKAGIGWTTTAHTAVPVPVYAWGTGADAFQGRMDNTDIAKKLRLAMGLTSPAK